MGKFVIRRGKAGFLFCLKAANGEIIAVSSAYASEAACRKGIESVAHSAAEAAVEDQTAGKQAACPKFEVYLDRQGRVLRVDESVKPGIICAPQRGARHVLELPAGSARRRMILTGDKLEVIQ